MADVADYEQTVSELVDGEISTNSFNWWLKLPGFPVDFPINHPTETAKKDLKIHENSPMIFAQMDQGNDLRNPLVAVSLRWIRCKMAGSASTSRRRGWGSA